MELYRGWFYNEANDEYWKRSATRDHILKRKNIKGIWKKNFKKRKLFGIFNIGKQRTQSFIEELKNGKFKVDEMYEKYIIGNETIQGTHEDFDTLDEAINFTEYVVNQKNKQVVRSEYVSLILISIGIYLYIAISSADLFWFF